MNEEAVKMICDDEDWMFGIEDSFSCGKCGKYFGEHKDVPKDMICTKCGTKMKY